MLRILLEVARRARAEEVSKRLPRTSRQSPRLSRLVLASRGEEDLRREYQDEAKI